MAKTAKKASGVAAKQEAENLKKKKMAQKKAASESEVRCAPVVHQNRESACIPIWHAQPKHITGGLCLHCVN